MILGGDEMEDFVGSLIGGEIMAEMLQNAMTCATTIFGEVTKEAILATLAFGFPLAKGGIKVIKRLARIGG